MNILLVVQKKNIHRRNHWFCTPACYEKLKTNGEPFSQMHYNLPDTWHNYMHEVSLSSQTDYISMEICEENGGKLEDIHMKIYIIFFM